MGNINNVVDPSVMPDLKALVGQLVEVENEITTINGKTVTIKVDLIGAESLTALNDAIIRQEAATASLTQAQNNNAQSAQSMNAANISITNNAQQATAAIGTQANSIANLTAQLQAGEKQWDKVGRNNDIINAGFQKSQDAIRQQIAALQQLNPQLAQTATVMGTVNVAVKNTTNSINILGVNAEAVFVRMAVRMVLMQALFVPIIAGITALWEEWTKVSDAEQLAKDRLTEYNDSFKELNKSKANMAADILAAVYFDESKMNSQISILKDQNLTLDQRFRAYKVLQGIAPAVLDDMTKEGFKAAENTDRMNKQVSSMQKYIELQEQINKGRELQSATLQAQQQNEALTEELVAKRNKFVNNPSPEREKMITERTEHSGIGVENELTKTQIDINKNRKDRLQIDKDLIFANTRLAELEKEKAALEGNTKDKKDRTPKDNKKEMMAQLKIVEENKKMADDVAQDKYNHSAKSYNDEYNLLADKIEHERAAWGKESDILKSFAGKIGETQNQELARYKEYSEKYTSAITKTSETVREVNEAIIAEKKKGSDYDRDYLDKLIAHQKELDRLVSEAQDKQIKYAIAHNSNSGLDLLGIKARAHEYDDSNFDISSKQNQVRLDNEDLAKAAERNSQAAGTVSLDEVTPVEDRSELQTKKIAEDRDKAKTAFDDLAKIKIKTETDTQTATDAVHQHTLDKGDEEKAKKKKSLEDIKVLSIQLAQETMSAINTIRDNGFAKEEMQLNILSQKLKIQNQQKIEAINATTGYQITKDNQLKVQAAQNAAAQNELQQKQNQLALKKAIADKQAAESAVLFNIAVAEAKAAVGLADPDTAPYAIAQMAVIAAIGAAQYSAAASTPLPQFRYGTGDQGTTTNTFIAGDGGKKELMVTPSGDVSLSADKPTIYKRPIGTKVFSGEDTTKLFKYAAGNVTHTGYEMNNQRDSTVIKEVAKEVAKIVGNSFDETGDKLLMGMQANRPQQVNNNSLIDEMRRANNLQHKR